MYIFETTQNIEILERCVLDSEEQQDYTQEAINEIFRIMHTIKGSSAMMQYNNISVLAHQMEDLFYYIRDENPPVLDFSMLSNLILACIDFVKEELSKVKAGEILDGDASDLVRSIKEYLDFIKNSNSVKSIYKETYADNVKQSDFSSEKANDITQQNHFKATVFFEDGCEMENVRAFGIIHNIKDISSELYHIPADIIESEASVKEIREKGFNIFIKTDKSYNEIEDFFQEILFIKEVQLVQLENDDEFSQFDIPMQTIPDAFQLKDTVKKDHIYQSKATSESKESVGRNQKESNTSINQSFISVNVAKLDLLMDLVGEMVLSEAMVIENPDLKGLELDNFHKAAVQLHKITNELQDIVMSIRMVPLTNTFHRMQRIVRDMSKKLNKEVQLVLSGEETEVDKNIIENISDPLMHMVRNAIDHGIESAQEREALGKPRTAKLVLEAKNIGNDVIIAVKDDGRGLNKEKILKRARENNLLMKAESEMTDKEIFNLVLLPGFSTKESITEYSGRGVGMDVVKKNIESLGGEISIESTEGAGSSFIIKIPLTLAIIDGMNIEVGGLRYTIPTITIKEAFRPKSQDLIRDPDGNEMIMMRGQVYSILRLHEIFHVKTDVTDFADGIFVMVEQNEKKYCIFADKLLGQQQVVVKSLPEYIKRIQYNQGIAGCTILGDGSISLILDIGRLLES